jgi:hypothetical protein
LLTADSNKHTATVQGEGDAVELQDLAQSTRGYVLTCTMCGLVGFLAVPDKQHRSNLMQLQML